MFCALHSCVRSYDEVCQLLTCTPESHAGLFYLGLGLFHPERRVREATRGLLDRVREHEAGRHFWGLLGRFTKVAFLRVTREMDERAAAAAAAAVVDKAGGLVEDDETREDEGKRIS